MAIDLEATAASLFSGVMAPLVLSGAVRPGHAIGARAALSFGDGRVPADRELAGRVRAGRIRRARQLVPVDALPDPGGADWALAAAFHDILQAANPTFDAPLRRASAARILDLAAATIERVGSPTSLGDAVSRHAWLARVPEVTRTDTEVAWWAGSREFRGADPPERLQAWPRLRNVRIVRTPHRLLELTPLAVDRARLVSTVSALLARTPLTDLATCTRTEPSFAWNRGTLGVVASRGGRTLALRALARLARADVDTALDHATRALLAQSDRGDVGDLGDPAALSPVLSLLAHRALMEADERLATGRARPPEETLTFTQAAGALAAKAALVRGEGPWSDLERVRRVELLSQPPPPRVTRVTGEVQDWLERYASAICEATL